MKLIKLLFTIAVLFAINTINAQSITDKWSQMHDFHELLSKTFKPAEQGNLNPIKIVSEDLVSKAELLDYRTIPQDLRNPKITETLVVLKNKTKGLSELITNKASDSEIMRAFQNLYDIFNRIEEMCLTQNK